MTKRKKKFVIFFTIFALLLIVLIPFPSGVDDSAKKRIISLSLGAVIENEKVLTNEGYRRLYDCGFVENEGQLYFENMIGVPDSFFLDHGLKPIPDDRELDVNSGDVIISFSYEDIKGNQTDNMQFYYTYGSLGGQVYEIKAYKSLLFTYIFFEHRGGS